MKIKIVDNFLNEDVFFNLKNIFLGSEFPWYYNPFIVKEGEKESGFQFTHTFFNEIKGESPSFKLLYPLFETINPKTILRAKINLGPITSTNEVGGWHTDFDTDTVCKTAVFYINTNNGSTLIKHENSIEKFESVENRFIEFDSFLEHTGVSQTDKKVRCVLNLNYTV